MINLANFFKNHLDSEQISDDELNSFGSDHLQRITAANDGGVLDPILADTGAKYIAYFGAISNEDVATAVREGLTKNVDAIFDEFKALVSRREGIVRDAFGKGGAGYQEFFPHGLTEYSNATKETVEMLMARMVSAANAHKSELGAAWAGQWTDIQSRYNAARAAQLGKKGDVSGDKVGSAGARTALELQLIGNMHFVGWKWPGAVEKCMSLFNQSLIRDQNSGGKAAGVQ